MTDAPHVRPTTRTRRDTLSLPVGEGNAIDAAARAHRLSRSAFIERTAMNQIGEGGRKGLLGPLQGSGFKAGTATRPQNNSVTSKHFEYPQACENEDQSIF